jgi:hypothetical protein
VPRLTALLSRRSDRVGGSTGASIPRQRTVSIREREPGQLVIARGADVLRLLDVAPPTTTGLRPGSLVLGFAVGAMVANRRRVR